MKKHEKAPKKKRFKGLKRFVRTRLEKSRHIEEDSTKSKPYKKAERRQNTLIIVLALLFLSVILLFTPFFNIESVTVQGTNRLVAEEVKKVSGIAEGSNIFRINKIKAKKRISAMPFTESVKIDRQLPDKILIEVSEHKECGFIKFMGNFVGINIEGDILEIVQNNQDIDLPVITGISLKSFEAGKKVRFKNEEDYTLLSQLIPGLDESSLTPLVRGINIKKNKDIQLTLKNDVVVELGDTEKLKYKLSYLNAVLAELGDVRGGIIELADTANVSYRGSNK